MNNYVSYAACGHWAHRQANLVHGCSVVVDILDTTGQCVVHHSGAERRWSLEDNSIGLENYSFPIHYRCCRVLFVPSQCLSRKHMQPIQYENCFILTNRSLKNLTLFFDRKFIEPCSLVDRPVISACSQALPTESP